MAQHSVQIGIGIKFDGQNQDGFPGQNHKFFASSPSHRPPPPSITTIMRYYYGTFQRISLAPREMSNSAGRASFPLLSVLLLGSACCGFVFYGRRRLTEKDVSDNVDSHRSRAYSLMFASSVRDDSIYDVKSMPLSIRSTQTRSEATEYYKRYKKLPAPQIMHDDLSRMISDESRTQVYTYPEKDDNERTNKILIIGDIHGCLDELKLLVAKASYNHNNGKQFASVIAVGDLCNKGPYSSEVVEFIRNQPRWYSIRGNHDNAALEAALGDTDRLAREQYAWVTELSDEDVEWMLNLPYTIRIPKNMISPSLDQDVLIVHAGLIPNIEMKDQDIRTMVTVRNLTLIQNADESTIDNQRRYEYYNSNQTEEKPIVWAKAWTGPELIIFGHDAKRGIQLEKYAIGVDSGCVYGNELTGIVFPGKELVSVDAKQVYCPIKEEGNR
jgi:hypothetical protein